MDPATQRLDDVPRSFEEDAYFETDRSPSTAIRTAEQFDVMDRGKADFVSFETALLQGKHDRAGVSSSQVAFTAFKNRHDVKETAPITNPLPHACMTTDKK